MKESLNLGEYPKLHVDYLPERLDFLPTPEITTLQKLLVEAMIRGGEAETEVLEVYRQAGDRLIESLPREKKMTARVGCNIARATTFRDAGRTEEYGEYLQDLLWDVNNLAQAGFTRFGEALEAIETELERVEQLP